MFGMLLLVILLIQVYIALQDVPAFVHVPLSSENCCLYFVEYFVCLFCLFLRQGLAIFSRMDLNFLCSKAGFELVILLPLPPQCWDYRYVLPCLASFLFPFRYIVLLNFTHLMFYNHLW
jgi:hypothetical protein